MYLLPFCMVRVADLRRVGGMRYNFDTELPTLLDIEAVDGPVPVPVPSPAPRWWLWWWLWWWCGWTCTTARGAKSCHKVKNMTTGFIVNWVFDVKDLCSGRRSPWSWAARRWHQWWGNLHSLASGQQFNNLRMEKNMISKVENIWAWRVRRSRKGLSRLPPKIRGGTGEKIKGGSGEK